MTAPEVPYKDGTWIDRGHELVQKMIDSIRPEEGHVVYQHNGKDWEIYVYQNNRVIHRVVNFWFVDGLREIQKEQGHE